MVDEAADQVLDQADVLAIVSVVDSEVVRANNSEVVQVIGTGVK